MAVAAAGLGLVIVSVLAVIVRQLRRGGDEYIAGLVREAAAVDAASAEPEREPVSVPLRDGTRGARLGTTREEGADVSSIGVGTVLSAPGLSGTVTVSFSFEEDGDWWSVHRVEAEPAWLLSVEGSVFVAWTPLAAASPPGQTVVTLGEDVFRIFASGQARFTASDDSASDRTGWVDYHVYEAPSGRRLRFDRFPGHDWVMATGDVVLPAALRVTAPPARVGAPNRDAV